jgi:hypothetical protein
MILTQNFDRITIFYDSNKMKSITQKFERWHSLIGSLKFQFMNDEFDLIKVIDKNKKNGKVFRESFIKK